MNSARLFTWGPGLAETSGEVWVRPRSLVDIVRQPGHNTFLETFVRARGKIMLDSLIARTVAKLEPWRSLILLSIFLSPFSLGQLSAQPAPPPLTPEQSADMVLNSAKEGLNKKDYAFAATRFREFLARFAGHKDASAAKYGL